MKKLLLSATILAGVGATPAIAADTAIILWNTANPGGAVDSVGTGNTSLGPENLGGVTVTLSTVSKLTTPDGLNGANINIDNTTGTTQTLDMIVGANGFTDNVLGFNLSATVIVNAISGGTSQATLAGSYFSDETNSLNGQATTVTGTDIKDFVSSLLTGPNSFSFNGSQADSVTGPYGLAERLTLTLQPGASVGVQGISMDASAVPEPRTWVMMLGGFALMAALGWRKARTNRLATI